MGTSRELPQDDSELLVTPDLITVSSNADTELLAESGGEEVSGDESGEDYGEKFDDDRSMVHPDLHRGLSPVVEVSPELASVGSAESLDKNTGDLESELDTALTRLTTLTDELTEVEEAVLESRQTNVKEIVTMSPEVIPGESDSRKNSSETSFEGTLTISVL